VIIPLAFTRSDVGALHVFIYCHLLILLSRVVYDACAPGVHRVVLTDIPSMLKAMKYNLSLNLPKRERDLALVLPLQWYHISARLAIPNAACLSPLVLQYASFYSINHTSICCGPGTSNCPVYRRRDQRGMYINRPPMSRGCLKLLMALLTVWWAPISFTTRASMMRCLRPSLPFGRCAGLHA